jgi:hypothetical protein
LEALATGSPHEAKIVSAYWETVSEAIKSTLREGGAAPVLVVDEFSYILQNLVDADPATGRADADKLLASLREWRGAGMSMLLTGSLGVVAMARKHKLNAEHLNDLPHFDAPELTKEEARAFVQAATQGKPAWTEPHVGEFLRQCGVYYPCFLVRGLLEIGLDAPGDASDFAEIFATRVRPDLHADFYRQFDTRFTAYRALGDDYLKTLVLPALKAVLESEVPVSLDQLAASDRFDRVELAQTLTMLTEDGFVGFTEDAEGSRLWKPASRLARLWWKRSRLA